MEPRNQVSKHLQLMNSVNILFNEDWNREAEIGRMIVKRFEDGSIQIRAALELSNTKVPPYKCYTYFTAKECDEKIRRLANLVLIKNATIQPGCSNLLDVLSDRIHNTFYAILISRKNRSLLRQLFNLKTQEGTSLISTRKLLLEHYMSNVESLFGLVSYFVDDLGGYHRSLAVCRGDNRENCQKSFVESRNLLAKTEEFINFESLDGGNEFIESVQILEYIVTQEAHRLVHPLNETPDLSNHFARLEQRAIYQKKFVENWAGHLSCIRQSLDKKTYKDLETKQNELTLKLCNDLIPLFGKLKKNDEYHHKHLKIFWQTLSKWLRKFGEPGAKEGFLQQLILDIKKSSSDVSSKPLHFLMNLATRVTSLNQTLMNEAWLVLLSELIKASDVSVAEMDTCINNLIDVAVMGEQEIECLQGRVNALKGEGATVDFIRLLWRTDFKPGHLHILRPITEQLKLRLQRCQKSPKDIVERALALRDAVVHLGFCLSFCTERIGTTMKNTKNLINFQGKHTPQEAEDLYQSLEEFNHMQGQAALVALEGVKNLIGRCFVQMRTDGKKLEAAKQLELERGQEAADKAAKEVKILYVPKVKKPRKIRRRRRKKKECAPTTKRNDNNQPNPVKTIASPQKAIKKKKKRKKRIPTTQATLAVLTQRLDQIQERSCSSWQEAQKNNLRYFVERLEELFQKKSFSSDAIFEETDLARRAIEAALELAMDKATNLANVQAQGHHLDRLLTMLLGSSVRDNIKEMVWSLRRIPLSLAEGNICVNYLHNALARRKWLTNSGKQLVDRLSAVNTSSEKQQESLLNQHHAVTRKSLYFIERLLAAVLDPQLKVGEDLPGDATKVVESEDFSASVVIAQSEPQPSGNDLDQDEQVEITAIETVKDAIHAVKRALAWIPIRIAAPVEGYRRVRERQTKRNIALKNTALYLRRFQEKLGVERFNRSMSTVLGQCDMMRSAHKELIIAALYHSDTVENGEHIVAARDMRYANNPCFLMRVLKEVSSCATQLPHLDGWMKRVHQVLSYPTPLQPVEGPELPMRKLIDEVRITSREHRNAMKGATLVLARGKTKSADERLNERRKQVETNEKERIFPALAALLHTLRHGLSIPIHTDL